jgi:hypothetical protein
MLRKETHVLCLIAFLLFVCGLLGCATIPTAHRYYSGPPLPNNETALIFTISTLSSEMHSGGCEMKNIRGEGEKEAKKLGYGPSEMIEVLPGQYLANFQLAYQKEGHKEYVSIEELKLNIQAGNIYVIYPEIEGKGPKTTLKEFMWGKALGSKWRPKVVNINDYSDEECSDSRYRLMCPGKDILQGRAAKYFESERRTISYHPSKVIELTVDGVSKQLEVGDRWK